MQLLTWESGTESTVSKPSVAATTAENSCSNVKPSGFTESVAGPVDPEVLCFIIGITYMPSFRWGFLKPPKVRADKAPALAPLSVRTCR